MEDDIRIIGMTPVILKDTVCFATNFSVQQEYSKQTFADGAAVNATSISGSMMLFCQPSFPKCYDSSHGVPKPVTLQFMAGDRVIELQQLLFTKQKNLIGYEMCDAAYFEWVAEGFEQTEIEKTINKRVTIS